MAAIHGREAIAAYLGVSTETLDQWRRNLGFPAITFGPPRMRRALTTTEAIEHWLKNLSHLQQQQLQAAREARDAA